MCASLSTYDSARGFSRGRHPELLSVSNAELSARETLPFLDASASVSRSMEAALFFLPLGGRIAFLLLVVLLGGGGVGFGVFGHCVRSAFMAEAASCLLALLLGLLLRRLVGRRNQHLRQKLDSWVFRQQSRTLDPLRLLYPALKRQMEKLRHLP